MQSNLNIPKWVLNIYNATSKSPHPPAKSSLPPTLCTTLPLSLSLFTTQATHKLLLYCKRLSKYFHMQPLLGAHNQHPTHTDTPTHTPKVRNPLRRTRHTPKKKRGETEKEKKKTKQKCMKLFYSKCMRYVKILWVSRGLGVRRIPFPPNLMCLRKGASSIFPAWIKWI